MDAKILKEQFREFDESTPEGGLVEHRQKSMENEEGGYATIEEIHEGLFGFWPALMRSMHFPGGEAGDGKRRS